MEQQPLTSVKGVGDKTARLFSKLGVDTVEELLHYYPEATTRFGSRSQRESCCRILWQQWRGL